MREYRREEPEATRPPARQPRTTISIHAYAVHDPKKDLQPFEYEPKALGELEVEVKVQYCGVCHSDLEMIDNGWGMTTYPLVPGHEAIGEVVAIGNGVHSLRVGQRVGVGWGSGSCLDCRYCRRGKEHLCITKDRAESTIVGRHGAWADRVRCQARWAVPIPDGLDPATAGPLMCAGTTVWSPIRHQNVRAGMQTAVIGVGGLGHLALQFLARMGCEVTAIGTTHSKEAEAREFGATDFIGTKGGDELQKAAGRFDFILSSVPNGLDWNLYVAALAPEGKLVICGIPNEELRLAPFPIVVGERAVVGGQSGSPSDTAEMLAFCAAHRVAPKCEQFAMTDVNAAVRHVREGKARYRAVLAA